MPFAWKRLVGLIAERKIVPGRRSGSPGGGSLGEMSLCRFLDLRTANRLGLDPPRADAANLCTPSPRSISTIAANGSRSIRRCVRSWACWNSRPARRTTPASRRYFHFLGRYSISPDYAVTEEDTLEFMHLLQSDVKPGRTLSVSSRSAIS